MKAIKNIFKSLTAVALLTGLAVSFNACTEQSPLQPSNDGLSSTLAKRGGGNGGGTDGSSSYPQSGSVELFYVEGSNKLGSFEGGEAGYTGGTINVAQGSKLQISPNSLTAPQGLQGNDVTITMKVKKVKKQGQDQLEFTFGPHGSNFNPRAEVTFDWTELGINVANLYYIDDGGHYVLQAPDQIDVANKKMTLYLDHFSRYAIGAE